VKTDRITDNAGFRLLGVLDLPLISDLIHIISSTLSQVSHRDSPESLSVAFLSVHSLEVYGLHWFLLSMLQCCNEDSPVLEKVRRIGLGSNQQNLILLRYFSPLQWGLELLIVHSKGLSELHAPKFGKTELWGCVSLGFAVNNHHTITNPTLCFTIHQHSLDKNQLP